MNIARKRKAVQRKLSKHYRIRQICKDAMDRALPQLIDKLARQTLLKMYRVEADLLQIIGKALTSTMDHYNPPQEMQTAQPVSRPNLSQ